MKKMTYAVTGANGQVGSYLTAYLRKQGHVVYELVRSKDKARDPAYYQFFDLAQPDNMPCLQGVDVLIHAAHFFDTTNRRYTDINITGAEELFRHAKHHGVDRCIFISTLSAHAAARSLYGKVKYQLEQTLPLMHPATILIRPGLVFHLPLQGITAAMDNFVKKYPVVPLIGRGDQMIYPCFLPDLARSIYMLTLNPLAMSVPIVAAAEQAMTFKQLIKYLAKQRNKRVMLIPIPFYGIYSLLRMVELAGIPIGLRSDSLLGMQYAESYPDFSATKKLGLSFQGLTN